MSKGETRCIDTTDFNDDPMDEKWTLPVQAHVRVHVRAFPMSHFYVLLVPKSDDVPSGAIQQGVPTNVLAFSCC